MTYCSYRLQSFQFSTPNRLRSVDLVVRAYGVENKNKGFSLSLSLYACAYNKVYTLLSKAYQLSFTKRELKLTSEALAEAQSSLEVMKDGLGPYYDEKKYLHQEITKTHHHVVDDDGVTHVINWRRADRSKLYEKLDDLSRKWGKKVERKKRCEQHVRSLEREEQRMRKDVGIKQKRMNAVGDVPIHVAPAPPHAVTPGGYIAGRAYLDEADLTAAEMEAKWGVGRLRLLVGPELRDKFDRQRYLLNHAIWHGELDEVQREAQRMVKAWCALDREATARGARKLACEVWEVGLPDGTVAAIVNHEATGWPEEGEDRAVQVYTLEEIGCLLAAFPALAKAKATFPGATVIAAKKTITDALDGVEAGRGLNDEIGF